ncbi:hypothetical protein AAHA92_20324 [Salvia divinorum]|uniref:Uncharacterized protein n=1 Tax=Salvia divinorum TaxID=28513 RepID=A0ABD1GGU6_SALDI
MTTNIPTPMEAPTPIKMRSNMPNRHARTKESGGGEIDFDQVVKTIRFNSKSQRLEISGLIIRPRRLTTPGIEGSSLQILKRQVCCFLHCLSG